MAFTPPDAAHHLARLHVDAPRFGAVGASSLDDRVPSCPDWVVRDLVTHVGMIHGWAAENVRQLAPARAHVDLAPPADDTALLAWADRQATDLLDVLGATDPAALMWTHVGGGPAAYWFRRMAQETGVHLLDLDRALGLTGPVMAPVDAADGVDEFLAVYATKRDRHGHLRGAGEQLVLHAADADAAWLVTCTPAEGQVTSLDVRDGAPVGLPADAPVLAAAASTLLGVVWGRATAPTDAQTGDTATAAIVLGRLRQTAI